MECESGWTVVKFREENAVEAVPSSWLFQDKCYWPPFAIGKIRKLIARNERPNTCWQLYQVEVFRNSTFDDYTTARQKASKAENTSDLNSDVEVKGKRKIHRKRLSSSESEYETELHTPPQIDQVQTLESDTVAREFIPRPTLHEDVQQTRNDCTCCPIHRTELEAYLEDIIKKQSLIRAHIKQLSDDVQGLQLFLRSNDNASHNSDAVSLFQLFSFPLKDEDGLQELESYLAQEDNFNRAVKELMKLGGHSTYEFVKRAIFRMMDDELTQRYSYHGAKKKRIFKQLKICQLLQISAEKIFKENTFKETEEAVKKWLRRAKERLESRQKTK